MTYVVKVVGRRYRGYPVVGGSPSPTARFEFDTVPRKEEQELRSGSVNDVPAGLQVSRDVIEIGQGDQKLRLERSR